MGFGTRESAAFTPVIPQAIWHVLLLHLLPVDAGIQRKSRVLEARPTQNSPRNASLFAQSIFLVCVFFRPSPCSLIHRAPSTCRHRFFCLRCLYGTDYLTTGAAKRVKTSSSSRTPLSFVIGVAVGAAFAAAMGCVAFSAGSRAGIVDGVHV